MSIKQYVRAVFDSSSGDIKNSFTTVATSTLRLVSNDNKEVCQYGDPNTTVRAVGLRAMPLPF